MSVSHASSQLDPVTENKLALCVSCSLWHRELFSIYKIFFKTYKNTLQINYLFSEKLVKNLGTSV